MERNSNQEGANRRRSGIVGDGGMSDSASESDLPLDVVYRILSNERRRTVIAKLHRGEGQLSIGELAEHVAAVENDKPLSSVGTDERKRAYVSLYQSHLPKMADAGVIDYDRDRGVLEPGPNFETLVGVLVSSEEPSRSCSVSHLVLALTGAALFGLTVGVLGTGVELAFGVVVAAFVSLCAFESIAGG